ncbi:TetR/AcrR family transcriptional regulator [Sphingomonas mali]|uniref:TetR/AcrR family transcriptional regulator n=1 Tax=Sphingomonas mali TaxID=40682 RepID=UPI0008365FB6|nr:TetR/AcrR family transcriptional regulator [Sphingomonas mali]
MKKERRTQAERTTATRGALIAAGRALFTERSYAEVSAEEIVAAAGVTRGALYHHFEDKKGLFAAVFEAIEEETIARIGAGTPNGTPIERIRAGTRTWLEICREPEVHRIALIEAPAVLGWERWRAIGDRYSLALVEHLLSGAIAAGEIPSQPVPPLAHVLLGMVREGALFLATAADPTQAQRDVGRVVDQLLLALSQPSGTAVEPT